jgi:hypothetical protein
VLVQGNETTAVNVAPFSPQGGWVASVNKRSPSAYQNISAAFFTYISTTNQSWIAMLNPHFGKMLPTLPHMLDLRTLDLIQPSMPPYFWLTKEYMQFLCRVGALPPVTPL